MGAVTSSNALLHVVLRANLGRPLVLRFQHHVIVGFVGRHRVEDQVGRSRLSRTQDRLREASRSARSTLKSSLLRLLHGNRRNSHRRQIDVDLVKRRDENAAQEKKTMTATPKITIPPAITAQRMRKGLSQSRRIKALGRANRRNLAFRDLAANKNRRHRRNERQRQQRTPRRAPASA